MKHAAEHVIATTVCLFGAVAVQGCGDEPRPPSFYEVASTAGGVRTGQLADQEGASWTFFTHDDELEDEWCADLAVAPDGVMRHLALLHPTADGSWRLSVRTGLGSTTWSSTLSGIEVPQPLDVEGMPAVSCHPVRIAHLTESLFGIVWISDGELHNAVYDSDASVAADLAVGPVLSPSGLEGSTAGGVSLTLWNDEVRLVWSRPDDARIQMVSGALAADGIDFGPYASFTTVAHEQSSDVVGHDGALYIAARGDDGIGLYRTTIGGTGWEEVASCETEANIRGRLLFVDATGDFWVAEEVSEFDNRLRSFTDCGTRPLPLAVVSGRLLYHPAG